MGTGGGAPSWHAQNTTSTVLGAAGFFFNFLLLSGLHTSDDLFSNSTAAQMMQDPGKQTSHAALWNSQVVSIMSSIPVLNTIPRPAPSQDMLNSPISFAYRTICIVLL